ncbi:F-box/kelch-repeat protein At3g61590-like [Chenopodium quinoa]|uniref:F-box domain-containing protein n=1 Tax=Chenopodium quinoa TaxID=63459 RepID=A0A803LWD2_CHEQI|nr:F-box/kelch-repeat protein At3g61590-like [Chenopodium quinoa]
MELEPSWEDHDCGYLSVSKEDHTSEPDVFGSLLELTPINDEEKDVICINSILPDDILERVFGHLPVSTIIKAGCVCKKWNDMLQSERFLQNLPSTSPQKPWYFMFTSDSDPQGHVYDPMLLKWYRFEIPYVEMPSWNLFSSSGLVCFMDNDSRRKLYVCNPVTRCCRKLAGPYGTELSDYCALAVSLDESSRKYTLAIVRSKQAPGEQADWGLSIDVYSSKNKLWSSLVEVNLQAWRSGADSVICGGILYFVVYLTRTLGFINSHYGVLAYDLASGSFDLDVVERVILAPCPVTCMRLMNIKEELVMVGGIEKQGRSGVIKGIGIWVLKGKAWEEVSRMPNKFFRGFGEFDDVFASSGFDNLIYIQGYGTPALLMFDMTTKEWRWSHKCPATKKFPLQLFSGICFEPRFDISP